ncbi:MAG: hypothetical protein IJ685_02655 [Selenomonadaceae bacterium]|nr:hypothetical protein [Selenomonadaceae bacterium]
MDWKKFAAVASFAVMLPTTAFAHGELWYDAASHLPQFKKIVVYPFKGLDGTFKIDENEKSEVYQANDYFDKRFVRKLKIKTVPLGSSLKENKEIRVDEEKYKSLYNNFSSEQERAAVVTDITAANGYVMSKINLDKLEPHTSPAKTVTVQMKSWTEESGGPNGNRTYDERTWNVTHTIPAQELMLYHLGMEYNMFDREGKKIMTYRNAEHTYGEKHGGVIGLINGIFGGKQTKSLKPDRYRVELFKDLVDEFRKDFEKIQDDFKDNKKKTRLPKTIGFKGINLPDNVGGDEYALKSAYFSMKNLALKNTDVKIDYSGDGSAKYFVQGTISRYSLDRKWIEPYVTLSNKLLSEEKSDWYDGAGKKHTKKIRKYETEIVDHHGYWKYTATVSGTFNLTDANGRTIVSHSATETDDKVADAYRHLLTDFYKKVNTSLTGKK